MQQRVRDNYSLSQLIQDFNSNVQNGFTTYVDQNEIKQLIQHYQSQKDLTTALRVVNIGLEQFKNEAEFHSCKAQLLLSLGDLDSARKAVSRGLEIAPEDHDLEILSVKLTFIEGNEYKALEDINIKILKAERGDRVNLLLCKAGLLEKIRDYERMFLTLKNILQINPKNTYALEKIWYCVENCRLYKDSVTLHKRLIDQEPYNAIAWYNLGHALSCLGEYKEAIVALEYAYIIDANFEVAYMDCAELCLQEKRYEQALIIYKDALRQFGPDLDSFVNIGQAYLLLNNPLKAIKYLKQAIHVDPFEDEAQYHLACAYMLMSDWTLAQKALLKAIKLNGEREDYYGKLAEVCYHRNDPSWADFYFRKATEANPEHFEYWYNHIKFYLLLDEIEHAQELLVEAELNTYDASFSYCKAAITLLGGNRSEGLNQLSQALEENDGNTKSFFNLHPTFGEDSNIQALINYFL